jgi:hypothetical protein
MSLWEYLSFLTDIDTIGGSEFTVPAQATVIMLGFPAVSAHVTITTGTGFNNVEGFQICFAIFISFLINTLLYT